MTGTVSKTTIEIITVNQTIFAGTIGIIVIILLITLLVLRAMIQAMDYSSFNGWFRSLDIAIVPLLLSFGMIIITALVRIIQQINVG